VDEEQTEEYITPVAKAHDRWSVLIIGLNGAARIADEIAETLSQYTIMASQHANQKIYDRRFTQIMKDL
jgi:hypothetical protein